MEERLRELAALLEPMPLAQFFSEHWEKHPLVLKGSHLGRFDRLMTGQNLEDLISHSDIRYPAIKLARDGRFYPPELFTSDVQVGMCTFTGVPDLGKVSELYGMGASITLPALHRIWRPVSESCARLEEAIDHTVHANAYITPGRATGFPPHYDCHDVLVLQIGGRKRWLIDEPTITLPHSDQLFNPDGFKPGPRLMEVELEAGDLLYLPRGFVHSTITSDSYSAHVTIGINIYSWVDVATSVMPKASEQLEMRRALPPGFASIPAYHEPMIHDLKRLLGSVATDHEAAQLLDPFLQRVRAAKRRLPRPFRAATIVLSLDSEMRTPADCDYEIAQRGDHFVLTFEGKVYGFPAAVGPTLNAMRKRPSFRLEDLPHELDEQLLLRLARHLQGIGFLQAVTSGATIATC